MDQTEKDYYSSKMAGTSQLHRPLTIPPTRVHITLNTSHIQSYLDLETNWESVPKSPRGPQMRGVIWYLLLKVLLSLARFCFFVF